MKTERVFYRVEVQQSVGRVGEKELMWVNPYIGARGFTGEYETAEAAYKGLNVILSQFRQETCPKWRVVRVVRTDDEEIISTGGSDGDD